MTSAAMTSNSSSHGLDSASVCGNCDGGGSSSPAYRVFRQLVLKVGGVTEEWSQSMPIGDFSIVQMVLIASYLTVSISVDLEVSNDNINWALGGSSVDLSGIGTASGTVSGIAAKYVRFHAYVGDGFDGAAIIEMNAMFSKASV